MFDGTDLTMAYGTFSDAQSFGGGMATPLQHNVQLPPPPQNNVTEQIVLPPPSPAATSHALPPEVAYQPPEAMYVQQPKGYVPQENIWDKLASKKYDVLKLLVLSFVVLFAISTDRFVHHYLGKYISQGFLTNVQEFFLRISYPVAVLVLLWIIKAIA